MAKKGSLVELTALDAKIKEERKQKTLGVLGVLGYFVTNNPTEVQG